MVVLLKRLIVTLTVLLGACASVPSHEGLEVGGFHVTGRVAVRYGDEAATGRVVWRHTRETDDLVIANPIGQGIAQIERRDGTYLLETQDGERYEAADPEALTEQVLGWRLPLTGLPQWIEGQPMADVPAQIERDGGRLVTLHQLGWRIEYQAWDEVTGLPKRIQLSRDDLSIRLAIEAWRTGQ